MSKYEAKYNPTTKKSTFGHTPHHAEVRHDSKIEPISSSGNQKLDEVKGIQASLKSLSKIHNSNNKI